MTTEKELKDRCTPDVIKWMVELADGFSIDGLILYYGNDWYYQFIEEYEKFPLLIHRTVEGWNNMQVDSENCIVIQDDSVVLWKENIDDCKTFDFKNYKPESLTQSECAMLDCLLNIFEGERK